MGRAVQCGGERRMSVAWRREKECAREPCRISWASSVQGHGQPLDCSSAFPVCARPRGQWDFSSLARLGLLSRLAVGHLQLLALQDYGGDGCCVPCLGVAFAWGSAGQGGLICSLRIKPQKSLDGTGLWHCKADDSPWVSNEQGNKEVQPVAANLFC